MWRIKSLLFIVIIITSVFSYSCVVFADNGTSTTSDAPQTSSSPLPTVLPATEKKVIECQALMAAVRLNAANKEDLKNMEVNLFKDRNAGTIESYSGEIKYTDILGCGIKTGDIMMWMVPYYIRYLLEFVIGIAGLVAVGGIVYGGYLYLFAGISDDKDKGKNAIKNGVIGLVLTLVAWAIVNIVIAAVTI